MFSSRPPHQGPRCLPRGLCNCQPRTNAIQLHFVPIPTALRRAFTLVEIMIVVVIIGLLAAMAIAAFQRLRERSLASRMANDIRQCESAFQRYCMDNGGWPPPGAPGVMPSGMAGYLPEIYTQATVVGGNFSWSGPAAKFYLVNTPASADV